MQTKKCLSLFILLFIAAAVYAGNKNSSFSGTWKLNREKTPSANGQIFLAKISMTLKNDSLLTVRTYENSNGETYPFNENLTMDGKECKIVIYDWPRKSKATWLEQEKSLVIESTTTFTRDSQEENLTSIETWKMDENGTSITVDYTTTFSSGTLKGSYYFTKSE